MFSHTKSISRFCTSGRRLLSASSSSPSNGALPPAALQLGAKLPELTVSYTASSNANFYLLTGGNELASGSSHNRDYTSSKNWITNHPIGPTLIDPQILTSAIHTNILAWSPGCTVLKHSYEVKGKPVVVGEAITFEAEVVGAEEEEHRETMGWTVTVQGKGGREVGEEVVIEGTWTIWMPKWAHQ
ncbi:hypothetical protein TrLO_g15580 [Triparma laevis f. longispina]|uniref:Uncharacterized protein n=1 Tax=Triparma laevis f. longispina TaxID=1714387 RepID=A0A9W7FDI7_9STRA|nr:hypothetical protein TrLO_g15580 [Triparma laevis f. longispina]